MSIRIKRDRSHLKKIIDLSLDLEVSDIVDLSAIDDILSSTRSSDLSIPSLDQSSTCSDSSFSLSSDLDKSEDLKPRKIFVNYWAKKGVEPPVETRIKKDEVKAPKLSSKLSTTKVSKSLPKNESNQSLDKQIDVSRRSIFSKGCVGESAPTLSLVGLAGCSYMRNAHSSSSLETKKVAKPCLRQSRYSGIHRRRALSVPNSPVSSVSFSSKVDVIVYQKPTEFWGSDNWSSFFS